VPELGHLDEAGLQNLVAPATLARGRSYARRGAVLRSEWTADGDGVVGEVLGTAAAPYRVSATVTRSADSRILYRFAGRCTCPVGYNCKHAVALVLAVDRPALRAVGDSPGWVEPLRCLLDRDQEPGEPRVALQFELVPLRPTPGREGQRKAPGIRLRPLQPSPVGTGNWVRTGIDWSRLDYFGWRHDRRGRVGELVALLLELRSMSGLREGAGWHSYGDGAIWLESIPSRRVWDLLRQAEEVGLPLVGAGRLAAPVSLKATSAELVLDLTRTGRGLRLTPRLVVGGEELPPGSSLLVGLPTHGVAWWDGRPTPRQTPALNLAPLARGLTVEQARLLTTNHVEVPAAEADRFESELLPVLRRRVAFSSSDGSVDLSEPRPDIVVCAVAYRTDLAVEVAWTLDGGRSLRDDPDAEAQVAIERVTALLGGAELRLEPTFRLEGMAAARFVTELLPAIEATPHVEVHEEGLPPGFREVVDAPVVRLGGQESADGDWFDLRVEISVGGEEVPFHDLFVAIAEGRSHLLLPSGTYFSLDRGELRQLAELIAEARSLHDAPAGQARLSRFQADLWEELHRLGVVSEQVGAWTEAIRALTGGDDRVRAVPAGLAATLRPYQEEGFQWLATRFEHRLGGILADDMGLGKTVQALALVLHAREQELTDLPFLVVAPTSVVGNWASEAQRFAPGLTVATVTETTRRRAAPLAELVAGAGLVVTSYALFRLDFAEYEQLPWAGMLIDEAQFAKNPASHNYQRARRLPVSYKLAITGTPLENSLAELWSLTSITAPGLFARPDRFAEAYRVPIERQGDEARLARLRRRIRPIMLRRAKADVIADLPEKQEHVLELDLDPRHRRLYHTHLQRERQKILGLLGDLKSNRFEILRSLTLLRQAALDLSLVDPRHKDVPSAKLDVLVEIVSEAVAGGHRILVFSQFTRFLSAARRRVEADGVDCIYLDGRTRRRVEVIRRFREGAAPVFFISLKAGGFGLNLTEADHCILLDPWWNPATEAQAVDRVHRIGQTRKVMVHRLVARDTIEEKVMALKAKKAKLFASVIGGGGFESAALTARDVRDLLAEA
jgi:superfamily II DNA or RNA helicase